MQVLKKCAAGVALKTTTHPRSADVKISEPAFYALHVFGRDEWNLENGNDFFKAIPENITNLVVFSQLLDDCLQLVEVASLYKAHIQIVL